MTPTLFDLPAGLAAKERGLDLASQGRGAILEEARDIAIKFHKGIHVHDVEQLIVELEKREKL